MVATCVLPALAAPGHEASQRAQVTALAATQGPTGQAGRLVPLEVVVNKTAAGQWTLLELDGALHATLDAFRDWRLGVPDGVQAIEYRQQKWFPLFAVPGFRARFDFANQSVELEFSLEAFAATRIATAAAERPALSVKVPAAFLNYDLSYTTSGVKGVGAQRDFSALAELGLSYGPGVLTSSLVGRNLGADDPAQPRTWRRLETTYSRDFPSNNSTLRLGDSSTRAGMWGRGVYFGGIQFGRNFGLTPGFVTQSVPVIAGTSNAPSTLELYINDALRQVSNVPTGPFTIENLPLLSGAGEARVVVRDLLGRETVLVRPFFAHGELLKEGLSDWSAEGGFIRRNLGFRSTDYGAGFLSALGRLGLSKDLTVEGRGEVSRSIAGGGVGLSAAMPFKGLGQFGVAASHEENTGLGFRTYLGFEKRELRHGVSARLQTSSLKYRQVGMGNAELPSRHELLANYRYVAGDAGVLGLGMARIEAYDRSSIGTVSASFAMRVGERGTLSFNTTRLLGTTSGTSIGITLLLPLGERRSVTASLTHRAGRTESYAGMSQPQGAEAGMGWRALAGTRTSQEYVEGGVHYQGSKGLVSAEVNASPAQQTLRLNAQGGLIAVDGRLFASRRVQDSFALVEVPGYPNVGVGFQGAVLARTDNDGVALVPGLLPYQRNSIRLDPGELPISAELDSIEELAVPEFRSGVKVVFPVRSGRGALVKIAFEDGEPAPPGAEVELAGDRKDFFVARRGEAFITGLQASNRLRLKWKEGSCLIEFDLPPGRADDIARVGPLLCKGVVR